MINDAFLHFVEYELQAIALLWMGILYSIKAIQLSRLPMPWEQGEARGSAVKGVLRSYAAIFLPWSRESSRNHPFRWLEFGLYHIAALVAIVNTFTLPFLPQMMTPTVKLIFAALIAPALPLGFVKLARRIRRPELRYISTPDDYFSLISLQFFFFSGVMVLISPTEFWRFWYFLITAAFLFYVPFSKISHYVYFFFAHVLSGSRYGHRGILTQPRRAR